MVHRIQIDISFDDKKEAENLLQYLEKIKTKTREVSGGLPTKINRFATYHPCRHDEVTPVQCTGYVNIDFQAPVKTHEL